MELDRMGSICGKTLNMTQWQCDGSCLDWWKNRFDDCAAPSFAEALAMKAEELDSHPEIKGMIDKLQELAMRGFDLSIIVQKCNATCNSTCRDQHKQLIYDELAGPNLVKQVLGANSTNDAISFDGYSGFVSLDEQGDLRGSFLLRNFQCQNGTLNVVNVAKYEAAGKQPGGAANYSMLQSQVMWPGPASETPISWMDICEWAAGLEVDVALDWMACALLILSIGILVLVCVNRDTAIIRHSSWVFCVAMLLAAVLLLLLCFLFRPGILEVFNDLSCRLLPWVYGASSLASPRLASPRLASPRLACSGQSGIL
jgi:hypothetical protein